MAFRILRSALVRDIIPYRRAGIQQKALRPEAKHHTNHEQGCAARQLVSRRSAQPCLYHVLAQALRLRDHALLRLGQGQIVGRAVGVGVVLDVGALLAALGDEHQGGPLRLLELDDLARLGDAVDDLGVHLQAAVVQRGVGGDGIVVPFGGAGGRALPVDWGAEG